MATKRVMVYGMHEHEIAAAEQAIPGGEVTESFVLGDADDATIAALRQRGLVVQELVQPEEQLVPRSPRQQSFQAGERRARRTAAQPPIPTRQYRIALKGPLLESWRTAIEQVGGRIIESLPNHRLRIYIDPVQAPALDRLGFLAGPAEALETAAAI